MNSLRGFTLLEVLVAVVILAISLTALLKSTQGDIHTTNFLVEKNSAYWIAENVLTEAELGLANVNPNLQKRLVVERKMLGRSFRVEIKFNPLPIANFYQVLIDVDNKHGRVLASLKGIAHAKS